REKYGWPKWDQKFQDPVTGESWTWRQIVQGMIDNFLGRESKWTWRLNDEAPPHFKPDGTAANAPIGIFAAMQNAKEIFEGRWAGKPYEVVKKGAKRE